MSNTKAEKIKIRNKKYYEKVKKEKSDKIKKQIDCECGGFYSYYSKSKHLKSKKHTYFIEHGEKKTPKIINAEYYRERYKIKKMEQSQ
jgi:hypothetical protein